MELFEDDDQLNIEEDQVCLSDIQTNKEGNSFCSQKQFNVASNIEQDEQMNEEYDIKSNNINIFTQGEGEPNQMQLIIDNSPHTKGEKEIYLEKEDQKLNTDENAQILKDIFKIPEQPTKEENEKKDNHFFKPAKEPDILTNEVKKKAVKKNKFSKMFIVHKIDSENINIYIPIEVPKTNIFGKNKKKFTFQIFKQGRKRKRRDDVDNIRKKFQRYVFKEIKNKLNKGLRKNKILSKQFDISQSLITNVTIKQKKFLNMTLKELLSDKHEYEKKEDKKESNIDISKKNKKIIQFLKDKNIEDIDNILEKRLKDVYIEYSENLNFEEAKIILNSKKNKEYPKEYITKYIEVAKNIVKYYEEKEFKKK